MRTQVEARGVSPEQAWRWWTDYREGAHDHAFARWAKPDRRVEELEDGRVRLTESGQVLGVRFLEVATLELAKPRIRFDARNNFGSFRGTIRFLPSEGGTRIEVVW
ncbi:MAG TPA: SRPBCC family protein, partial [Candidatus Thermoplasmatota archaeon]|nr:SRPBCC family protein [Candidatus Thermoplasmatota archaeon]